MLLAEDLLLLLTDDSSGKLLASNGVDQALGGANLVDLTLDGRVDLTGPSDDVKPGRLVVRDPSPTGDELLDQALRIIADHQGKKPDKVIGPLSKKLKDRLYQRLAEKGVLRAEKGRVLGIFPTSSWPSIDARHEESLRSLLEHALVHRGDPNPRTAAVVSLLHALRATHKVIDPKAHELRKKDLDRRAKEISEGDWGSAAVRSAIDSMNAAVMAAVTASTVAAGASAGSG